jgi:transposase InsO family protein
VEDVRRQFIEEWMAGDEGMSRLCRRYAISRKTGYQVVARFEAEGWAGLAPRSHAPHEPAHVVSAAVHAQVLALRGAHPYWGARKLRATLQQQAPGQVWPAASTVGALLQRHGLTRPRRPRLATAPATTPLAGAVVANDVWSADFKGWFRTRDGARCTPFTLTDNASRFLLRCQHVARGDTAEIAPLMRAAFREYGLPRAIRTDNGPPFGSTAAGGLSRLAVGWIKLGIWPERIEAGHPEQNGRHERMHATLAEATTRPPAATCRAQQRRFDTFRAEFNHERPHEALGQRPPATEYAPSPRPYPERLPALEYPTHAVLRPVRGNGAIKWRGHDIFISQAVAGELIALTEVLDDCWRVAFGPVTLGWLDTRRAPRPPRATARDLPLKLLPISPV